MGQAIRAASGWTDQTALVSAKSRPAIQEIRTTQIINGFLRD
jgi:hypothetical protein